MFGHKKEIRDLQERLARLEGSEEIISAWPGNMGGIFGTITPWSYRRLTHQEIHKRFEELYAFLGVSRKTHYEETKLEAIKLPAGQKPE